MAGRCPNTEFVLPVIVGTVAIHLGKKQTDQKTHQWTVYVRSANNEDISHIITKVVFKLHPSFSHPARPVEGPSYELTETGWGEFDIAVELHFAQDIGEKPVELFHRLKLYSDDDPTGQTRKPVTSETYEELVFSCPYQGFYQRIMIHQPRARAPLSIEPHIKPPSEAEELQQLNEMRRKVAVMSAQARMQLQAQPTDSPTAMGMHM